MPDNPPASAIPYLPAPTGSPARHRYAIACRSSAIVLDREGQAAAAAALRSQAALLERLADSSGDAVS